ncbi:MAG TPA: sugar ABC transporter permease [Actinomycetes bacterium]|jgi:multiple sugar transport system permease protein|nr:sugar ABC transporter permease [Actinomycetes bacterium]
MVVARLSRGRGRSGSRAATAEQRSRSRASLGASAAVRAAFIWPALLAILFVSIFPLLASLYISLSHLKLARGGFRFRFIGLENYRDLYLGGERSHFLGVARPLTPLGWLLFAAAVALLAWGLLRARRAGAGVAGMLLRLLGALLAAAAIWLALRTLLATGGRPGTAVVTVIYVLVGIAVQFTLGLGLAYLLTQGLPGQRFFRVVFLLPMMITPVGVAYMFRMLADTSKGPLQPLWSAVGLGNFSWVNDPWGARVAVMVGDIWQWTPFMFIILLAALEGQDSDHVEAAMVDGANRWQVLRHISLPAILPVCTTVVLIRLIEAFKIIDLPNILTNGGPGTATESLSLQAYIHWRTLDLGESAAVAYSLLFIVTVVALSYVNLVRRRVAEE